jgi:FAD/FMN-containing dehydrogenase
MRARVAGLEAMLADGRVLRRLSGLVKDNAGYDLPALLVGSEGTLGVITAVRLALVEAPGRLVTAMLGAGSMAEAAELVARARRPLPGLHAAEVLDDAGMALVRAHFRLPHPLAAEHPVYVLLETADDVEALADAVGDAEDVVVADDTARREALWQYREGLNPAVNAAGVPHKLDVSVPMRSAWRRTTSGSMRPCWRWRPSTAARSAPSTAWAWPSGDSSASPGRRRRSRRWWR